MLPYDNRCMQTTIFPRQGWAVKIWTRVRQTPLPIILDLNRRLAIDAVFARAWQTGTSHVQFGTHKKKR